MFNKQSGLCAICKRKLDGGKHTHVDHDHVTGVVRGLLCSGCNVMIGYAKENVGALESAVEYLLNQGETK